MGSQNQTLIGLKKHEDFYLNRGPNHGGYFSAIQ
jgi:hypothetical protein